MNEALFVCVWRMIFFLVIFYIEVYWEVNTLWGQSWRGRGTKCDCKIDLLWIRSQLEEMKYLFTFCVVFRQWTRNTSRTRRKIRNNVLTLGSLCLPCCVRDTAWSWFFLNTLCEVAGLNTARNIFIVNS